MDNSEVHSQITATFTKPDHPTTMLVSEAVDIPSSLPSEITAYEVGETVRGTVCYLCEHYGVDCNPSQRIDSGPHLIQFENIGHAESGYSTFKIFPPSCPALGNTFIFEFAPDEEFQLKLVSPADPSQDSTSDHNTQL